MGSFVRCGRYLFAVAIAGAGVQHVLYAAAGRSFAPGPPWIAADAVSASLFGGALIVMAIGIAAARRSFLPAAALGGVLLVYDALFYLPAIAAHVRSGSDWTRATKLLAMCGTAFVIAGDSADRQTLRWPGIGDRLGDAGMRLFAFSVLVWGVQHFMYAELTAAFIPAWMPWRLFWALFAGTTFLASAIAFAFGVRSREAGTILGALFLGIALIVHVGRVSAQPGSGVEWTSALAALTMAGGSFAIAEARRPETGSFPVLRRVHT